MSHKKQLNPAANLVKQNPLQGLTKGASPAKGIKPKAMATTGSKMGTKGMGQSSGLGVSSGMKGLGQGMRKPSI
jgi:hypothetical protein